MFPVFQSQNTSGGLPLGVKCMAAGCAIAVTLALCRRTRVVGWVSVVLVAGTLLTVLTVIVSGLMHFDYRLLTWPADVFGPKATRSPLAGLGGAMTIAIYDYLGYYNVCHLGEEVRDPGRTIPRAVLISVVLIAVLYLTMNTAIIAVVPWQEAMKSQTIAADFMERLFGRPVAVTFTALILWSVVACVFAMTLGYSRIPFAAARNGDFFPVFGQLDARGHYPTWSLLALGGLTAVFCFLPLQVVIDAAVTVRILIQFVAQIAALDWLRRKRPDVALPFRMKLYPLPSLIALCGWFFVFGSSNLKTRVAALAVVLSGVIVFAVWQALSRRHSGAGLAK
jgi:amino acid transporter